jgi:ankyrin repeat protein
VAANNDHEGMVPLLFEAGADVEAKTKHGQTALHVAVQRLNLVAAIELLECGANPNATNGGGNTPLQELSRMERVFGEPMVLNGVRISSDEEVRECQALAMILVRKGAVP